jgi:hypothetical protein
LVRPVLGFPTGAAELSNYNYNSKKINKIKITLKIKIALTLKIKITLKIYKLYVRIPSYVLTKYPEYP